MAMYIYSKFAYITDCPINVVFNTVYIKYIYYVINRQIVIPKQV